MPTNWLGKSSELKLHCFCLIDAYSMPKDICSACILHLSALSAYLWLWVYLRTFHSSIFLNHSIYKLFFHRNSQVKVCLINCAIMVWMYDSSNICSGSKGSAGQGKEGTSMTSIMEHSAQYRIQIFSLKFDVKYRDSPVSAVFPLVRFPGDQKTAQTGVSL